MLVQRIDNITVVFGDVGGAYSRDSIRTSGYFDDPYRMIDTAVYIYNSN